MKKTLFTIIAGAFMALNSMAQYAYKLPANTTVDDYMANTIIIKVNPLYRNSCTEKEIKNSALEKVFQNFGVSNLHKKFPRDKSPERLYDEHGFKYADLSLVYELNFASSFKIEKTINALLASKVLVYAEPHFIPKLCYSPNDPMATPAGQYHLQNIQAFAGWDVDKGDSSIVIGITDTGIELTHEDLNTAIKYNYADPIDNIDNDNDGYTDNFNGWDLGVGDNDPTWQVLIHGIHVSGLAGAQTDNGVGGSGTGFKCKILPVKISNAAGSLIAAYEGIKYAADHGCKVINCSWGGTGFSQYGQDIVDYATINKNSLVVAAAGNNGLDQEFFPAAFNYVFTIANSTNTDEKYNSSNYGYFIDVTAPGTQVYSTIDNNGYLLSTGTSMASPVASGVAGIVRNHFPAYTPQQIIERIKLTSDDTYSVNPTYIDKLGKGRINLFRALTDPATPSVVFTDKVFSDHNDNSFILGDTLFITGKFMNFLDPTGALNATVTPLSAFATNIDNTTTLGVINTLASATNTLDPFSFKLVGAIPTNYAMNFEVLMSDGSYTAKSYFTVYVNVDYINITENDVFTTATGLGKIGYNQDAQIQGLGFKYKEVDILYEGGLMIGTDSNTVADCVRGANPSIADTDFSSINKINHQIPSLIADDETRATFSANNISINVQQNTLAWGQIPNMDFVIWEYVITNTHATDTVKNLRTGIFCDWDIDGGTYAQNRSAYDASTKMGYSYFTGANGKYAGIKLLTNTAPPNFYGLENIAGGGGGIDMASGGFDSKEKYLALSTQRLAAGLVGAGTDIANIMSAGPYDILPGQDITVAFALLGGDSLTALINSANQAQIKYDGLTTGLTSLQQTDEITLYPNPNNGKFTVNQKQLIYKSLQVYNINGQLVKEQSLTEKRTDINLIHLSNGMYVIKLIGDNKVVTRKVSVVK